MAETERFGVLAGGNWIIDHVKLVDTYPEQDALASILSQSRGTGGSPYNLLLGLAKLGAPFPLSGVGLVGEDEDGNSILEDCASRGICVSQMHQTREAGTSYTDVMTVSSTGRRTFFHKRGANSLLDEDHFDLEASSARILHLGYLLLLDRLDPIDDQDGTTGAARLLKRARALGLKTSVDMVSEDSDRFAAVVAPALPHTDYLVINEFEASRSTGIAVCAKGKTDFSRASEAAAKLLAGGVNEWVVIHTPEGALARNRAGEEALQGSVRIPEKEIAGTAGAGDAFATGLLFGLHEGHDIRDCLELAVCTAASSLSYATCTEGIRALDECLRLGQEFGFRTLL